MQYNNGPKTFEAGTGGVPAYRLVKLASGKVVLNTATSTDDFIGSSIGYGDEGDNVAIELINKSGTVQLEAAGAITSGAIVYGAANGMVRVIPVAAGTYRKVGIALEAASGAGSIIEVLPYGYNTTTTV